MFAFTQRMPSPFKSQRSYERVLSFSERSSSDGSPDSSDGLLEDKAFRPLRQKRSVWQSWWPFIIVHLVIFTIYAGILYAVASNARAQALRGPGLLFSPAREAVIYEETTYVENSQEHGPFSGYPREEIDQNWRDLLNAENIKIEPEFMRYYDREDLGVALPEGDGYIGTLNVYHELHCIKRLYQYNYPDYYWKDITDSQREVNRLHNEHCLDFLRQSAMCHGDIGLITFQWSPTSLIPIANATRHECINWKKLDAWTRARTVDMMKPGYLIHPLFGMAASRPLLTARSMLIRMLFCLGPAYPDGKGDPIGAMKASQEPPHLGGHHH
ncbi:hypothetical protein FGG08_003917 [Glutinoglossum americanum]|uniref:Uncharacterized protein n=1 Tax=Glutinoglossum americanum TaxID=1670608 RepID=A0A9P8KXL9_9PEZI|nr:hypothetical protein FGG08_003917 [Glutinoglossum americanum]